MEDLLRRARGVISTRVGYTGGEMPDPTYARHYGHAEAVEVTFDPDGRARLAAHRPAGA
ncbi:peptide-methionine (S)-S-oxide reductase (plasmid) [Citrobacter sp. RHBSTW-00696]|nr:peptide-methionine (S)-S-oxide reductase [Citrobacter sp. RHBSTW-00696]